MRNPRRTTTALLAAGVLTIATAAPASAQTPADIMVPLGGTCVINVTQVRVDGDCTLQFVGGAVAAALAVFGLGSLGSSGDPIGTPDPDPTDPDPTDPDPDADDVFIAENYTFSSVQEGIFGILTARYVGEAPANPGTISLRLEGDDGEVSVSDPNTPLTESVSGYWVLGETGKFVVVYTPIGGQPVDVAEWSY